MEALMRVEEPPQAASSSSCCGDACIDARRPVDAAAAVDVAQRELEALLREAQHQAAAPPNGVHRRVLRFVFGGLARRGSSDALAAAAGGASSDDGNEEMLERRPRQRQRRQQQQQHQQLTTAPALGAHPALGVPLGGSAASVVSGGGGAADSVYGTSDDDDAAAEDLLGSSPFASCADLQVVAACRREVSARRLQRRAAAAAAAAATADQQQQQQQQQQATSHGPLRCAAQWLVRAVRAVARVTGPQGPGNNDTSFGERVLNVLTSAPFALVGAHSLLRAGGSPARRHFGLAFVVTGAVAAGYHATAGAVRVLFRRADYYSIAYTSAALRAAAGLKAPRAAALAAAALAPFKPTLVTGANLAAVEARFLRAALRDAGMRAAFGAHLTAAAAALTCFSLEDVLVAGRGLPPVVHALWHALAAVTLGLVGPLLAHADAGAAAAAAALLTA